jgi:hypothetical protein
MKYQRTSRVRPRPNSLLVGQEGSDSGEEQWTESENQALVAEGFHSSGEEDDLWSKDGVWFGRNAALQNLRAHAAPGHRQSQRRLPPGGGPS